MKTYGFIKVFKGFWLTVRCFLFCSPPRAPGTQKHKDSQRFYKVSGFPRAFFILPRSFRTPLQTPALFMLYEACQLNPSFFLFSIYSMFPSTSAGSLVGSAPCVGALYENVFPYLVAPESRGLHFPSRGSRNLAKALQKQGKRCR